MSVSVVIKGRKLCLSAVLAVFLFWPVAALADCTDPDGNLGDILFNGDYDVFQGCTFRGWARFHDLGSGPSSSCPSSGLVGYWKLNETSGTSAADSAGSNTGTLTNGPTWTTGQVNGAVSFDGTNDYVSISNAAALNLTSYTLAAWVKTNTVAGGYRTFIAKSAINTGNYYLETNGDEWGSGFYSGGWKIHETTSFNMSAGIWYHVVAVFDDAADIYKIYVNGSAVLSDAETATPETNTGGLYIGSTYGVSPMQYWNGLMDDVRVYNTALSAQEVSDLYNSGAGCE